MWSRGKGLAFPTKAHLVPSVVTLCLWCAAASAVPEYGCPVEPAWDAVPCSMHTALQPSDGSQYHLTHALSQHSGRRDYMAVAGESAVRIQIYPHFDNPGWVANRVASAWAAQPAILRRSVMPLIISIDYAGPVYWPSYNVAVTECQIADDSLSHFSHIPSNLTPATRV